MPGEVGVRVRRGVPGDLDVIAGWTVALGRESEGIELDAGVLRRGIGLVLEGADGGERGWYYVATAGGESGGAEVPVGQTMITREWSDWRCKWTWWIQNVYVDAAHRRRGVFRSLYEHVVRDAQAQGASGVRLYADTGNDRALGVYRSLGMHSHYAVFEHMFDG